MYGFDETNYITSWKLICVTMLGPVPTKSTREELTATWSHLAKEMQNSEQLTTWNSTHYDNSPLQRSQNKAYANMVSKQNPKTLSDFVQGDRRNTSGESLNIQPIQASQIQELLDVHETCRN